MQPIEIGNKNSHGIFVSVLIGQWVLALILGFSTDSTLLAVLVGALIVMPAIAMAKMQASANITKYVMVIALQLMAALHIQQVAGMTEMHFQVFVMIAFASFYRDWKVVVASTAVVAIHHIAGFAMQHSGGGLVVFEDSEPQFIILAIHAAFAVLECAVLSLMAFKSNKEHKASVRLSSSVKKIVDVDGRIHLLEDHINEAADVPDFQKMLQSVRELVSQVNTVGHQLVQFSETVYKSSNTLDETVDAQNSQVSSISTAMKEMTQSIHQVAELSQNANGFAETAKSKTHDTRTSIDSSRENILTLKERLSTTSEAISDLSLKCQSISDVMQSIKSVAEQTNLLALNAAIESARKDARLCGREAIVNKCFESREW